MKANKRLNFYLIASLIYFILGLIVLIILMALYDKGAINNYADSIFCIVIFSVYIVFSLICLLASYLKTKKNKTDN